MRRTYGWPSTRNVPVPTFPMPPLPYLQENSMSVLAGDGFFNGGDSGFLLWRKGLLQGIGVL